MIRVRFDPHGRFSFHQILPVLVSFSLTRWIGAAADRVRTGLALLLCLTVAPAACTQDMRWSVVERMIENDYPDVPHITTDSLATRLSAADEQAPVLLDAREPDEYAVSHLDGAVRIDPGAGTHPVLDTLDRDAPIVVYCSVGYRSAGVTERLQERGFTQVTNLKGSIFRWANEGRPVVRESARVEAVHPYDRTWGTLLEDSLHAYEPSDR
jgi:rhodanese-related sulfurtransferase